MPIRLRTCTGSMSPAYRFSPWYMTRPSTRADGIRSFIRFKQRMNVDFPHPDGPINAVISFACRSSVTSRIALWLP
jgi:hypothetical protein